MLKLHFPTSVLTGLAAGLLLVASTSYAHPRHGEGPGRMADRLEITEEQRQALRDARAAHREAMAEARASGDREQIREQARAMREHYEDILTDEQIETLRSSRELRGEHRIDRMVERMRTELELHSSQVEPVRDVLTEAFGEARQRMRALAEDDAARGRDRAAMRAEWERLMAETRERLGAILTPAQLEQYDAMRPRGRMVIRRGDRG